MEAESDRLLCTEFIDYVTIGNLSNAANESFALFVSRSPELFDKFASLADMNSLEIQYLRASNRNLGTEVVNKLRGMHKCGKVCAEPISHYHSRECLTYGTLYQFCVDNGAPEVCQMLKEFKAQMLQEVSLSRSDGNNEEMDSSGSVVRSDENVRSRRIGRWLRRLFCRQVFQKNFTLNILIDGNSFEYVELQRLYIYFSRRSNINIFIIPKRETTGDGRISAEDIVKRWETFVGWQLDASEIDVVIMKASFEVIQALQPNNINTLNTSQIDLISVNANLPSSSVHTPLTENSVLPHHYFGGFTTHHHSRSGYQNYGTIGNTPRIPSRHCIQQDIWEQQEQVPDENMQFALNFIWKSALKACIPTMALGIAQDLGDYVNIDDEKLRHLFPLGVYMFPDDVDCKMIPLVCTLKHNKVSW